MKNISRDARAWIAVIACCAGIFWSGTLIFGFPGVMGEYWRETFQVSTAATSKITMFVLLLLGCFSFVSGKIHLKYGTRVAYLIGTILMVASMFVLLFGNNIYMVYLWAAINGASSAFFYSPGLATVQRWIPLRKGLVTGMVSLVFGISAAIMSPIFKVLLIRFDYRTMLIITIIAILVVNLTVLIFCEMPEFVKMSEQQRKDHDAMLERVRIANEKKGLGTGYSYKPKEAIRTVPFWCMCVIWACMGAAGISMVTLSTNYAAYLGIAGGVIILTVFNITNGVSRLLAGFLSDKIGGRTLGFIAFVAATIGYFGLNFGTSFIAVLLFAAFVGYGFGTMFAISAPVLADIYGIKYFGLIFGLVFTSYGFLGGILGPNLYGIVFQSTGSYHPVFIYLGIFALVSAILIWFVRPIRNK